MAVERCDQTDLPVDMCSCQDHGGQPISITRTERVHAAPEYTGPRPPKDAILISGTGVAHWYGCDHLPGYEYLVPPKYGWIEDRDVWTRIGNHTIEATGGNPARVALRRCLDCDY